LLSENFLLTGAVAREIRGKDAYVNLGFWKLVKGLRVKEMIVDSERAFVLVNYDLVSPKGTPFSSDVAEFWKVKNGKLDFIAIYFDTAAFNKFMAQLTDFGSFIGRRRKNVFARSTAFLEKCTLHGRWSSISSRALIRGTCAVDI